MLLGSALAWQQGLKPVYDIVIGGNHHGVYIGLLALAANFVVAVVATPVAVALRRNAPPERMRATDFDDTVSD
jgi:SSS family solute:Na+ symporter